MSSPISKQRNNKIAKQLKNLHQKLSHSRRVSLLANHLADLIRKEFGEQELTCLDVGCGDMSLAEAIHEKLPNTKWICTDIYPLPEILKEDPRWGKYISFDGKNIPLPDNSVDIIILIDVLHHIVDDQVELLKECRRVGRHIIVKDHFEYGIISRTMLRLMDIVGNWGYGVSIPKKYYTEESFSATTKKAGLQIAQLNIGLQLYAHLPFIRNVIRPKWHFLSILK